MTADTISFDSSRPFSKALALAAGISRHQLAGPRFQRLFYDCYIDASVPVTTRLRAAAALQVAPIGSYLSHWTAAEVWGGIVPKVPEVHLTVRDVAARSRRAGVRAHVRGAGAATSTFRGLAVSTPGQVFLELAAAGLSLVDLVVLGDSLVRKRRVSVDGLVEFVAAATGRGAEAARRAARFVRAGVDSAMESRLRMLIVLAGLPEPTVNFTFYGQNGAWEIRLDLSYPDKKLIVEYEGRQHGDDIAQWHHDLRRREYLERRGWRLIIVTSPDFHGAPETVLHRIRNALVDRGVSGLPARFDPAWRSHFLR